MVFWFFGFFGELSVNLNTENSTSTTTQAEKMPGFISHATSDSRIQLFATAVISGGIVAAGLLSYQRLSHEKRVSRLKDSIPDPSDGHLLQKVSSINTYLSLSTPSFCAS